MSIAAKNFAGREIYITGVYTDSKYPDQDGLNGAATNNVVVIGESASGIPYNAEITDENKLMKFTKVSDMQEILEDGKAYLMAKTYLSPTPDLNLNKPGKVFVLTPNQKTQSFTNCKNGTDNIITLKSARYGKSANQLCKKIENGSISGKKVTLKFKGERIIEKDNIELPLLKIKYLGAGTASTITITGNKITTICTDAENDNLDIDLTEYSTLKALLTVLEENPAYDCILVGREDEPVNILDEVISQDIKTSEYTIKADVEALIRFFNNESNGEIIAVLSTGAKRIIPDNDINLPVFYRW